MLNTFIAYRLPETESVLFFDSPCTNKEDASFIVSPFNSDSDQTEFYFNGKAKAFNPEVIVPTSVIGEKPHITSKEDYINQFKAYKKAFKNNHIQKAILSRVIEVDFSLEKLKTLFNTLVKERPNAFVYWLFHPEYGHWIGATPEVLLTVNHDRFETVSLAGTLYNGSEWSDKEFKEQEIVTDYICDILEKNDIEEFDKVGPTTIKAGPVRHLKTTFIWQQNCHPLNLAQDLHPTPAVCGIPKESAFQLINDVEKHERQLYTGFLGPIDNEQPHFFVNLRCMQFINNKAYIYVGGGITPESDPEKEWLETNHKALTLLGIIEKL